MGKSSKSSVVTVQYPEPGLEVTFRDAQSLKNTEWLTQQDPYIVVSYDNQRFRTRMHQDGGVNPVFNSQHIICLREGLMDFRLVIMNKNSLSKDAIIGAAQVNFQEVFRTGQLELSHPVYNRRQKERGKLNMTIRYIPAGSLPLLYKHERKDGTCYYTNEQIVKHNGGDYSDIVEVFTCEWGGGEGGGGGADGGDFDCNIS